jgi:predicted DNA binding CopG/RHH family protein
VQTDIFGLLEAAETCQAKRKEGVMKGKKAAVILDAPRIRSEADEAEWWDSHQDLVADLLLKHGRRAAIPSKSVTVRIPVTDLDKARQLAEAKGIGYQTLIKVLLHDALKREKRAAS